MFGAFRSPKLFLQSSCFGTFSFLRLIICYPLFQKSHLCPSPGKCQNLMGSFICSCPEGFELSPITNICEDIDECLINPGICENGVCTNTIGGAFCTCPEGYVLSHGNMKCIDMRKEQCYDQMYGRQCSKPRGMVITAKECCCSKGAAWGRYCKECPKEGSGKVIFNINF